LRERQGQADHGALLPAGKSEPVRHWLKNDVDAEDRKSIGIDIMTVEFSWPVGMPLVRPVGGGLHEVRTNLADGTARVLFAVVDGFMILLHGFIKKTKKTPKSDLDLARARLKAYTDAQEEREES
jgi:phage-related protein